MHAARHLTTAEPCFATFAMHTIHQAQSQYHPPPQHRSGIHHCNGARHELLLLLGARSQEVQPITPDNALLRDLGSKQRASRPASHHPRRTCWWPSLCPAKCMHWLAHANACGAPTLSRAPEKHMNHSAGKPSVALRGAATCGSSHMGAEQMQIYLVASVAG